MLTFSDVEKIIEARGYEYIKSINRIDLVYECVNKYDIEDIIMYIHPKFKNEQLGEYIIRDLVWSPYLLNYFRNEVQNKILCLIFENIEFDLEDPLDLQAIENILDHIRDQDVVKETIKTLDITYSPYLKRYVKVYSPDYWEHMSYVYNPEDYYNKFNFDDYYEYCL